ncbi:serine/Arginine-related protein 53 isoform X2 [Cydia pomonella]|uniref:serine/Arginine-related protein 53 isoform X2 n=1 Tax=Cydia pomonella TaxID=82600 RepID=UPI002ADE675A|nr:serine/Arginine-related protein 53 isoform X2 [Cydia pomonella]
MPREKSSHRDRRSSSYSSESSYERKKTKSKHKKRSRSRDRSVASSHKSKSSSLRHRRRSYSRSLSRDRYESKSRRRSSSRPRTKRSRRSVSRSRSRSRTKHSKSSKKSRRRSRSRSTSSRSSSFDIAQGFKSVRLDDTETKVEQAIKAAEAAGLTMTKIPTYEYPEVEVKEDMPTIHDRNLLAELNSDVFIQRSFTSSKNKKQNQNIVIDLDAETVKVPKSDIKVNNMDDTILNMDEIPSEEELREMWIKKLYQYRKRMLRGEI